MFDYLLNTRFSQSNGFRVGRNCNFKPTDALAKRPVAARGKGDEGLIATLRAGMF